MQYPYSIKDLATKVNKTNQSLQKFLKKNNQFVNLHTLQTGRFKMYDQAVMDLVCEYYNGSPAAAEDTPANETPESDQTAELEKASARIAELEAMVTAKDEEIAQLKEQLSKADEERKEMIRQNGSLLLLLQEEKQEKMLLLPAPKKTFRQKIAAIFGASSSGQKNSPDQE